MEGISEEQEQEYIQLRDNFHKKRDEIEEQIDKYNSIIEKHKKKIKKLEEKLEDSIPVIKGCSTSMICEDCGIYSMKYVADEPGQGEHYRWHECVICGYEDYYT